MNTSFTRLDLTVVLVITAAMGMLGAVIAIGNPLPIHVTCANAEGCEQIGPSAVITLKFSKPVKSDPVEKLFTMMPSMPGRWNWLDNQNARWTADKPFAIGARITFELATGQVGLNGEHIQSTSTWTATVRQPQVVFSIMANSGPDLFITDLHPDKAPRQLTHSGGSVFDFSVSPGGEEIVYAVVNAQKGADLWVVQRNGTGERKLLDCSQDRCTTPVWSPVSDEIAYTRESSGIDPNGPKGAPRVWILNVDSSQTAPLLKDPQKVGYGPNWSPDGQKLALWSGTMGGIQVVNRSSGETVILNSASGETGCWAADSKVLYYSDTVQAGNAFRNVILKADLEQGTQSTVFGDTTGPDSTGYASPVCHPGLDQIAVSLQKNGQMTDSEIDLLSPNDQNGQLVVEDPEKVFSNYSWNPDGSYFVYQADILGSKENQTEIWVWNSDQLNTWKVVDGGQFPQLLP